MYGFDEFGSSNQFAMSAQEAEAASVVAGAQVAGSSDAAATARAAPIVRLPPVGSVGTWLAALVDRDGPEDVVRALLGAVPPERLMDIVQQLCASEFGVNEPTIVYDSGEVRASRGCPAASSRLVCASRGCPAASSRLSASPRSSRVSSPGGHVGGHTKGEHREPCERAAHQEALAHGERRRFRVPPQALLAL